MRALSAWSALLALCACDAAASGSEGRACDADSRCAPLVCVASGSAATSPDLGPMPLSCAAPSSARAPGGACERPQDCDRGLCLLAGTCARACGDTQDCGDHQRCQRVYARRESGGLATTSACINEVDLPSDARIGRQEIPAAFSGGRDTLTLARFEPQTLYVVEHLDDMSWPVPSSLSTCRPPLCAQVLRTAEAEPKTLFDLDQVQSAQTAPDNPIAHGSHVNPLTVWIPNGRDVPSELQDYTLEVKSTQPGSARITSIARPSLGLRLDLNLYYVGAEGLSPEGARGPAVIEAALEEVDRILDPTGIFLGEVRQVLVPESLAERGSEASQGQVSAGFSRLITQYRVLPELPELLRLSAGAANPALDVFFVADIEAGANSDVGGISAGTPVAFGMHGGPGSGIAIAADMFVIPERSQALGRTLAHELCHALGLFHTTETNGVVFDPLPDTPSCPLERDDDASGALDASECADLGGDNLMFPTSDAGDQLTEQQAQVLRRALILQ